MPRYYWECPTCEKRNEFTHLVGLQWVAADGGRWGVPVWCCHCEGNHYVTASFHISERGWRCTGWARVRLWLVIKWHRLLRWWLK